MRMSQMNKSHVLENSERKPDLLRWRVSMTGLANTNVKRISIYRLVCVVVPNRLSRRFENHTASVAPVETNVERFAELHAANEVSLGDGIAGGKPVPVDESLPNGWIDREISDTQRRQILKEVRPL